MKNPKEIEVVLPGAIYAVPTFVVADEGIIDGEGKLIYFCKGDKSNPEAFRQEGLFVETLIQLCKESLEYVNTGNLATRETAMAITKLDEALMWLNKRSEDRKLRAVQGTYQK